MDQIILVSYYYYIHIHVIKLDLYAVEIIIGNLMLDVLFQKEVLSLSHLWRDRIEYCIPVIMGLMIQLKVVEQLAILVEIRCTQC